MASEPFLKVNKETLKAGVSSLRTMTTRPRGIERLLVGIMQRNGPVKRPFVTILDDAMVAERERVFIVGVGCTAFTKVQTICQSFQSPISYYAIP